MAMPVQPLMVGVDVAKAELVIATSATQEVLTLANQPDAIAPWLHSLPAATCIAVEATSDFHRELITAAHAAGHTVYVIDGYRLSRYRDSVGGRAKTDRLDAQLLLRYLGHERKALRAWQPPPAGYRKALRLLHRRARLVQVRTSLRQSLREVPELQASLQRLLREIAQIDAVIQKALRRLLRETGWHEQAARIQRIEGIGPLTSLALTLFFHRGHFRSGDAFIAFLGLDVRVRDSGTFRGRRKLTKRGDPEARRLLFNAAMTASRSKTWHDYYQHTQASGKTRIQALVILARKLARIAFALLDQGTHYQPKPLKSACPAT